ncbi:pentapeptide repeat-containing protein [Pseudaestuariivita sp.]|uniref:pentapeptide repeat-containing protein n=1 Tax=Pseudaestuariivita sp. TaxID=2211669 RepID=UPI0040595662
MSNQLLSLDFRAANLSHANLIEANLSNVKARGVNFSHANLTGAKLHKAQLMASNLAHANLSHATLDHADMTSVNLNNAILNYARLREVILTAASLANARLNGADLGGVKLNRSVNLNQANMLGACLRNVDEETVEVLRPFWQDIFADGSVQLNNGARPSHWATKKLGDKDFFKQWHTWQRSIGMNPD